MFHVNIPRNINILNQTQTRTHTWPLLPARSRVTNRIINASLLYSLMVYQLPVTLMILTTQQSKKNSTSRIGSLCIFIDHLELSLKSYSIGFAFFSFQPTKS